MTELNEKIMRYFPYVKVRPHQGEFIRAVYETVENGQSIIIEGSNGLGKTIAVLSACLPTAIDKRLKILYVARTHRQHDRVIEELSAISEKEPVSGISIRGRHEMCLNNLVARHPLDTKAVMEICELLKAKNKCQYYKNIEGRAEEYSETLYQIAVHPHTASEIQKVCRKSKFCPYELAKSLLDDVNVIALSYLYIFDPVIRAAFLRNIDTSLSKIVLVIDEAHNLPDTAADVASSGLSLFGARQAEIEAKRFGFKDIADFARIVDREIREVTVKIAREALVSPEFLFEISREKAGLDKPLAFFEHISHAGNMIRRKLLAEGKYPRSFVHGLGSFLHRWVETAEDQSFVNVVSKYTSKQGIPTAKLEIVALDPSKITEPVFSQAYSVVVTSGTLQPLEAYIRMTKLPENTAKRVVPSPFPREHILSIISCGVTTAMEERTPEMYAKIVGRIREIVTHTPANTGIFASSFEVLGGLLAGGLKKVLDRPLFCEHRGMSSGENEKMVAEFKTCSRSDGAILLGVQGGRSSEGVDFPGDEMNSVAIVGLPYSEPTPKVKAQIDYFEKCFPTFGREYGYVLPAMKKASQAAGRPIRALEDKGAMVFLDHRFASPYCQSFLPLWIRENLKILPDRNGIIASEISDFFRKAC